SCITVECDADSVGLFDRTFHLSYGLKGAIQSNRWAVANSLHGS
ncbi:unnamed protein product, partial [Urochloa humidicola]